MQFWVTYGLNPQASYGYGILKRIALGSPAHLFPNVFTVGIIMDIVANIWLSIRQNPLFCDAKIDPHVARFDTSHTSPPATFLFYC